MDQLQVSFPVQKLDIGRLALMLAMSISREQEGEIKEALSEQAFRCCITEVGGERQEFDRKFYKAVIGAALNNEIIVKNSREMHALLHATEEAKKGFLLKDVYSMNIAVKISIVRSDTWLAVAMYGYSAMHSITNHSRVGLGMMHI